MATDEEVKEARRQTDLAEARQREAEARAKEAEARERERDANNPKR